MEGIIAPAYQLRACNKENIVRLGCKHKICAEFFIAVGAEQEMKIQQTKEILYNAALTIRRVVLLSIHRCHYLQYVALIGAVDCVQLHFFEIFSLKTTQSVCGRVKCCNTLLLQRQRRAIESLLYTER